MVMDHLIKHEKSVFIVALGLLVFALVNIPNLSMSADTRVFFGENNPQYNELKEFEATYSANNNIVVAITSEQKVTESAEHRSAIRDVTKILEGVLGVIFVDTLANLSYPVSSDETLAIDPILDSHCDGIHCDESINHVLEKPFLIGRIISEDKMTSGNVATLDIDSENTSEITQIAQELSIEISELEKKYPNLAFSTTGGVPMSQAYLDAAEADSKSTYAVTLFLIVACLWYLLGSFTSAISMLICAVYSAIVAMGIAGFQNTTLNTASSTVPIIVTTLVVASSMHLFLHYLRLVNGPQSKIDAIRSSLGANTQPILITVVTSAASLSSLLLVDSPPIQDIGLYSAIGILVGGATTLTLLPLLIYRYHSGTQSSGHDRLQRALNTYAHAAYSSRNLRIAITLTFALGILGIFRLEISDDFVGYFGKSTEFRQNTDRVTELLASPNHIELDIEVSDDLLILTPEVLSDIAEITENLRLNPVVSNLVSIHDILSTVAEAYSDEGAFDLSEMSPEVLEQYFLSYELSLGPGESASNILFPDGTRTRIPILLGETDTKDIRDIESYIYSWFKALPRKPE